MPKKIVILNGSPRKKGNTSTLVKAFTQGAVHSCIYNSEGRQHVRLLPL